MINELNYPQWNDPEAAQMAPYIKTFGQSRPGFKLYSDAETLLLGLGVVNDKLKPNLVDEEVVIKTEQQEIVTNLQTAIDSNVEVIKTPEIVYQVRQQTSHLLEWLVQKTNQFWSYWVFKLATVLLCLIAIGGLIATVSLGLNGILEQNVSWQIVVGLLTSVTLGLLIIMLVTQLMVLKLIKTNNQSTILHNYGLDPAKGSLMTMTMVPIFGLVASWIYGKRLQALISN